MTGKSAKLVCICNCVSEKEILLILKKGAKNLEEVKKFTYAATSCGRCTRETEMIIQAYTNNKNTGKQEDTLF